MIESIESSKKFSFVTQKILFRPKNRNFPIPIEGHTPTALHKFTMTTKETTTSAPGEVFLFTNFLDYPEKTSNDVSSDATETTNDVSSDAATETSSNDVSSDATIDSKETAAIRREPTLRKPTLKQELHRIILWPKYMYMFCFGAMMEAVVIMFRDLRYVRLYLPV